MAGHLLKHGVTDRALEEAEKLEALKLKIESQFSCFQCAVTAGRLYMSRWSFGNRALPTAPWLGPQWLSSRPGATMHHVQDDATAIAASLGRLAKAKGSFRS